MAKKEESAASQRLKEAERQLQQRQAQKVKGKKPFVLGKFVKDFRADIKKIIWPDSKTVLKNTGIVLLMVAIVGAAVYLIDLGMVEALKSLHTLAEKVNPEVTAAPTTEPLAGLLLPWFFG
ncbi:MAG: preprotein translocase subunit SecE [Oscillospiraceae bacterium]|jgi:preprotein translocase SecE subunit|nr:preprotein translocase subunit SecE [Oscillospiraceae bacterium]